jgi:hypothetical protein
MNGSVKCSGSAHSDDLHFETMLETECRRDRVRDLDLRWRDIRHILSNAKDVSIPPDSLCDTSSRLAAGLVRLLASYTLRDSWTFSRTLDAPDLEVISRLYWPGNGGIREVNEGRRNNRGGGR